MPNWITNVITIKTKQPKSILEQLFTGGRFDFNKLIPQPLTKQECPRDCYNTPDSHIEEDEERPWFDWYHWNNKYWGTKWGACDTAYNIEGNKIIISFDTAWAPPMPILKKLKELFKNSITFKCYEEWGDLIVWARYSDL